MLLVMMLLEARGAILVISFVHILWPSILWINEGGMIVVEKLGFCDVVKNPIAKAAIKIKKAR